jgi:predicted DNA-binding transcriptional regulator YafY
VVRAKDLAQLFDVTERTIYRDIRTLENAGVSIGSEPGVGYFLDKSYNLPPIMFSRDEAAA